MASYVVYVGLIFSSLDLHKYAMTYLYYPNQPKTQLHFSSGAEIVSFCNDRRGDLSIKRVILTYLSLLCAIHTFQAPVILFLSDMSFSRALGAKLNVIGKCSGFFFMYKRQM